MQGAVKIFARVNENIAPRVLIWKRSRPLDRSTARHRSKPFRSDFLIAGDITLNRPVRLQLSTDTTAHINSGQKGNGRTRIYNFEIRPYFSLTRNTRCFSKHCRIKNSAACLIKLCKSTYVKYEIVPHNICCFTNIKMLMSRNVYEYIFLY